MITTRIIADSVSPDGHRITTGLWTYPRFIHSEVMTHRMLVKNSASSRAIPVSSMIEAVRENPATFEEYGAANKGMSAQDLMDSRAKRTFDYAWDDARLYCIRAASDVRDIAAKQMVNRMLEPWMHMTIIVTATDWHNFFALRAHPAAQPEFQVLAYRWLDAYLKSTPRTLEAGQWHLPLVEPEELEHHGIEVARKISVARCARVSYTRHECIKDVADDEKLHDQLIASGHMSPAEHQAQAAITWGLPPAQQYFGCFKGWRPYRKTLPNENRTGVDLQALLNAKPDWITL